MSRSCIVLFVCFILVGCNRKQENVVAEVNGEKITSETFAKRYGQFIGEGSRRDNIVLREQIINNMINERLIYLDIARQHFDSDELYQKRMVNIRGQALVDGYSRSISADTLRISDQEYQNEFRYYNTKVSARYLYAKDKAGALELKERLGSGERFEELAKDVFEDPGLATNGGYLGAFGWGEMEPALEEAAFNLPLGTVSDPIKLNIGYGIVKVETRVQQPLASEYDYIKVKQKLENAIIQKKVARIVNNVGFEIGESLRAKFNEEAVDALFKNWSLLVSRNSPAFNKEETTIPGNISKMPLVQFKDQSWTVGQFVDKLEFTAEKQRRRVQSANDVKQIATGLATRDVLVDRALKGGLENDPEVQKELNNLRERFLLKRWSDSVLDTVGQSGWDARVLDSTFNANKAQYAYPPEVNVGEILVRIEWEAKALRSQLRRGANFADLARKNSIRIWAAKRGGELGFGTQATFGVMGQEFFKAKVGEIVGPEKVDPYWGIFKILERKEGKLKSFDEAREDFIAGLIAIRKQEVSRKAVEHLRSVATVTIDKDVLANVVIQTDNQAKR